MEFTERLWSDQIQNCRDLDELKSMSQNLVRMHFASRGVILQLLKDGLPRMGD